MNYDSLNLQTCNTDDQPWCGWKLPRWPTVIPASCYSHSYVSPSHIIHEGWSVWPIIDGRSDEIALQRLGYKKTGFQLRCFFSFSLSPSPSPALSLSHILHYYSTESNMPCCCNMPNRESHMTKNWSLCQWIERWPANGRVTVRFLVRAHACVSGQVPSWRYVRGNQPMCLWHFDVSLFLPPFHSL